MSGPENLDFTEIERKDPLMLLESMGIYFTPRVSDALNIFFTPS